MILFLYNRNSILQQEIKQYATLQGAPPSPSILVLGQTQGNPHPPPLPYSELANCKEWSWTRGAGGGCHHCIMPLGTQHPRYTTVGLQHSLYPSSFCCTTMVPNYYCIPNFKVPYCSPNLDAVCFAWFLITVCCKVGSSRYRRLLRSLSGISWAGDSPHHLFKMPAVSCIVCLSQCQTEDGAIHLWASHDATNMF